MRASSNCRKVVVGVALLLLTAILRAAEGAVFTAKPTVKKDDDGYVIAFAVAAPTDVEVAVLDGKGNVVRHVAAGMLGKNAPEPLQKDALAQIIVWDGKDDLGRPAAGGPFKIRVQVGSKPQLDKIVGWDGNTFAHRIEALTVGKNGELFVLATERLETGQAEIRVLDKKGKYLRTIMPYSAGTPKERTESVGHLMVDGTRVPVLFNGRSRNVYPLTSGMGNQSMVWHPKGYLIAASGVGSMAEQGPPRHLLALHPEGGAPDGVPCVGPQIRAAQGFLGSTGERGVELQDRLAVSPDGEYVYLVQDTGNQRPKHGVYRLKWGDAAIDRVWLGKDEAGSDDAHFNQPQGLVVDTNGCIYVCDRGNDRVMRFAADGKFTGKFTVECPEQIALHAQTGEFFVLSRKVGKKSPLASLRRFTAWDNAEPKESAVLQMKTEGGSMLMALDPQSSPAQIWIAVNPYETPRIFPVVCADGKFALGAPVTNDNGLRNPAHLAGDPDRGRVLVREYWRNSVQALDLTSGKITRFCKLGTDIALDAEGNVYVTDGYLSDTISRYDAAGNPAPFPGTNSNKMRTGRYRDYGPNFGRRGHRIAPNGDIYLLRSVNLVSGSVIDVFGPDGKLKKTLVSGLGGGDCGLGVDAAGNVYVASNLKTAAAPLPDMFAGKVPGASWTFWKAKRDAPWRYPFVNPYLFYLGSVFKFGPEGGAVYGDQATQVEYARKDSEAGTIASLGYELDKAPASAAAYKSCCLHKDVKVVGAKWSYLGVGTVPGSVDAPPGDSACVCIPSELDADLWGRVYAPNNFMFSIEMLDTNGNLIQRIGKYGNADDNGPGISFAGPAMCSYAKEKLYVSDTVNNRVVVVKFDYAASETCDVK